MSRHSVAVFARNLNHQLDMRDMTQIELCERLNLRRATVSSWCAGTKFPRIDKIELLEVAAGYTGRAYEDYDNGSIEIPRSYLKGHAIEDFFLLRVKGDSMYPLYMEGDIVLVLKQKTLNRSGDIGVIRYDGDNATLKKVEYVMGEDWMKLIPINPQYPPMMIENEDLEQCEVLGIPRMVIREIKE